MGDAVRSEGNVYRVGVVAQVVGLPVSQIRGLVRQGLLTPDRGPRGELRLSFQDLVLLRNVSELSERVPARRMSRALRRLTQKVPHGRPLSGFHLGVEGDRVVVEDGAIRWLPESGQLLFDFELPAPIPMDVIPLARKAEAAATMTAESWYELGCRLEVSDEERAADAYLRAVELDPTHADAHVNLGRLLHERGEVPGAEAHYLLALAARPEDATALFNLGVALEDLSRTDESIAAYQRAIAVDAECADAHFNLARLMEQRGDRATALRHLRTYRKLTRPR